MREQEPEVVRVIKNCVGEEKVVLLIKLIADHIQMSARTSLNNTPFAEQAEALSAEIFTALVEAGILDKKDFKEGKGGDLSTADAMRELFDEWLEAKVEDLVRTRERPSSSMGAAR